MLGVGRPLSRRLRLGNWRKYHSSPFISSSESTVKSAVPTQAEVVIIGGGVIGASALYHLADAGVDTVLLERADLTHGSTWHAAGLTTYFHPGANARHFHYESLELYKQLEKETGLETGLHEVGSIRLIESEERLYEAKVQMGKSALWRANQRLITPEEVKSLHPLVNIDGILAGVYNEGDGHIDPTSVTNCLVAAARSRGGTVIRKAPVRQLHLRPDHKWEVVSEQGTVVANKIINAAGLWCDIVARMAGVEIPIVPILHQYVITGAVQEVIDLKKNHNMKELPVLRDLYGSYYLRQERNGLLIGPYENKNDMLLKWEDTGAPDDFGPELFEGDLDRILPHVLESMHRVPAVEEGGIKNVINGPVAWAPDGNPLIGPVAYKPNYWNMCGFSYGVAQGGGAGRFLKDWIINGEPPYALEEFDTHRYGAWSLPPSYKIPKTRETYGFNNVIVYPHEEREAGRPVKIQPVDSMLKEHGCAFGFHNGWEVPLWFAGKGSTAEYQPSFFRTNWQDVVEAEVDAVNNRVGIFNATAFSKYFLRGPGAENLLNYLCANKMPKLGRSSIVHMLTPAGKMHAELTITRTDNEEFYIVTGSEMERHDERWFWQHMPKDGSVELSNVTDTMGVLAVVGPRSRDLMSRLTSQDMAHESFKFLDSKMINLQGIEVNATRISYTGELGWELHHRLEDQAKLYHMIWEEGSVDEIANFGSHCQNSFRLEKGFRLLGSDMTKDHSAVEAGLVPRFVKLDKGDFIGRDAAAKEYEAGSAMKAVQLTVDSNHLGGRGADCQGNEPIYSNGSLVGFTTSGGYGYTVKKSLAFGYVNTEMSLPGTNLEIELLGERCSAEVAKEPLVPTEPTRTRMALKAAQQAQSA